MDRHSSDRDASRFRPSSRIDSAHASIVRSTETCRRRSFIRLAEWRTAGWSDVERRIQRATGIIGVVAVLTIVFFVVSLMPGVIFSELFLSDVTFYADVENTENSEHGNLYNTLGPVALASDSSPFVAQAQIKSLRPTRQSAEQKRRERRAQSARAKKAKKTKKSTKATATSTKRSRTQAAATTTEPTQPTPESTPPHESTGGFIGWLKDAIRSYALWIVLVLFACVAGVVTWMWIGGSSEQPLEEAFTPLDSEEKGSGSNQKSTRYSTTKIKARDVNDRLEGGVEETQVETDREYALVVDEDALKSNRTEEIDEHTGHAYADSAEIERLLDNKEFDAAFKTYVRHIEVEGEAEFHSDIEKTLSEHFLQHREFDKAARVLEHHVATHAPEDVSSETYFNLGYIHFFNRTMNKSRRFLKLFVENAKDAQHVDRAKKILRTIDA